MTRLEEIVSRITYKPNIKLNIIPPFEYDFGATIQIIATVPDTYHPDNTITVQSKRMIRDEPSLPDEFLIKEIQWFIRSFELHEMDEWFRLDGEIYDNPHKGGL